MTRFKISPFIALIIIIGILAVVEEWQPVKKEGLWVIDAAFIMIALLYIITILALLIAIRRWAKERGSKSFAAFGIALAFVGLIWGHRGVMSEKDAAPDVFSAWTMDIGGDGGFYLSFKKGHYVTAQKQDQWMQTFYRGSYSRKGDTIDLDIPVDFPLSTRAVIEGDTLHFLGSKAYFHFTSNREN